MKKRNSPKTSSEKQQISCADFTLPKCIRNTNHSFGFIIIHAYNHSHGICLLRLVYIYMYYGLTGMLTHNDNTFSKCFVCFLYCIFLFKMNDDIIFVLLSAFQFVYNIQNLVSHLSLDSIKRQVNIYSLFFPPPLCLQASSFVFRVLRMKTYIFALFCFVLFSFYKYLDRRRESNSFQVFSISFNLHSSFEYLCTAVMIYNVNRGQRRWADFEGEQRR